MKKRILLISILTSITPSVIAEPMIPTSSSQWAELYQPPYKQPTELPVGSKLRKELFNMLRKETDPATKFKGSLKAFRNWAVFIGETVNAKGQMITHPPFDNPDTACLWIRTTKGWVIVESSFGHSDAFYIIWPEIYGTPKGLIGME
ncbi:hypothetical protein ACFPK9_08305 [Rubritalea spongiae]|uniref:Uncharacterized protein n=1 Tax=Rubritalea spongiae TaxID=430797 RepID=A0ABW5E2F6_9BACT